ncbi:cilia- and flagella-associated protein 43 [Orycteropus afer afer]|uniref:Cilia- and flagella-associated protein 43 n=1 Tax=Orycteropus afer afer TaxID=1230840 RepID=A0A8B6ZSW4_ORYAF|nr:cilia- and flagella-associated protein 43 [Orycteropus afer afer]
MAQGQEVEEAQSIADSSPLFVRWVQGFPKQNVQFVNNDTICYPSGNYIIFINVETKEKTILQCVSGIVGIMATNIPYEVVAFSDRALKPVIYIYTFPGLTRRTKLKGNILLDYTFLTFSHCGTYLASYSSLPEYELTLWVDDAMLYGFNLSFKPKDDLYPLLHPTMHCWTPTSDLYVGCEEGHLLMVNGETLKVTVLSKTEEPPPMDRRNVISPITLAYQKEGVVASGIDGFVYSFIIKDSSYKVMDFIEVEEAVEHLMFSPHYKTLLIQTEKGSIYTCTFDEEPTLDKVLTACDGNFQAIDFITPGNKHFMMTSCGVGLHLFSEVGKGISQISTVSLLETDIVEVMVLVLLPETGRSKLEIFTLPTILPQVVATFADERGRLRNEFIHKYLYEIDHMLSSAVLDFQNHHIFGFCNHMPYICTYLLPETEHTGVCILKPFQKAQSRHYGGGKLCLSSHGIWLFSTAKDGFLYIRNAYTLETFVGCQSHSYHGQGIQSLKISMDGQDILVNGKNDSTLICLKWKHFGGTLATDSLNHYLKLITSLSNTVNEENDYITTTQREPLGLGSECEQTVKRLSIDSSQEELISAHDLKEISWIQAKSQEAIRKEVSQFSKKRKEIKKGIKELAKTVLSMMEENETVNYIAKLDQQEFSLDVEELERLHDESEEEVAKIKNDTEMGNLAKRYLTELIKEECWNSMAVKGRALKCFHIPYVVENFPMKERTAEELKELEKVLQQKKIETECLKVRQEIVEVQSAVSLGKKQHEEDDEEEEEENVPVQDTNLPNYLLGSLSTDFGVDTSFLSSQLELHSREEKINQIVLLKDIIYKVKTVFNNEFNAAYKQKEFEIARVRERNVRLQEIILDLELEETVWQPEFEECEKPERTLVVEDSEVKQKAAGLMEMMAFLRKRIEDDEKVQQSIEKVFHELILLQEEKVEFQLNLTIQILLKQGQVELENFQLILEYSDAILINKNIIEDLNSVIRTQGQKKVTSMVESKDVHKGIYQIEWEHKKMEMEMEDLNQKAWDIQMLFFSRDRQKFLNEPHYETLIAIQIGIMEQTIAVLDKTHKKNVENCKKLLKKLGRYSNHKDVANYTLSCNLREELVAVSERRDICNVIGSKLTCEKIARERYENLMQQQKLTHISKQQAEQIAVLQAEVERLRMRTFPALVQM